MSAEYWVLISDKLMDDCVRWPAGMRPVRADRNHPPEPGMRWWLIEDDDAPAELDGRNVELTFRDDGTGPRVWHREVLR